MHILVVSSGRQVVPVQGGSCRKQRPAAFPGHEVRIGACLFAPPGNEVATRGTRTRRLPPRRASATDAPLRGSDSLEDPNSLEDLPLPKGDRLVPIIGGTLKFLKNQHGFIRDQVIKYGPVSRTSLLGRNTAIVAGNDLLQQIMVDDPDLLVQGGIKDIVRLMGETSIEHIDGNEHMKLRRLLNPIFSRSAVNSYIPQLVKLAEDQCRSWEKKKSSQTVKEVQEFVFTATVQAALGVEFPLGSYWPKDMLRVFDIFALGMFSFGINLPFTKFGKAMAARQQLLDLIDVAIDRFKRNPELQGGLRTMLLGEDEEGNRLELKQIQENFLTLLLAGYDTTSLTFTTAIMRLVQNPEMWEKVREEQDAIVAQHGPEMTEEAIKEMRYTEAVIREGMRILPPTTGTFTVATRDFEVNGYRVPKGWMVIPAFGTTAQYFDRRCPVDADFRPDRFLPGEGLHTCPDLALGFGAHVCLGGILSVTETKILLATMARGYDFNPVDPNPEIRYTPLPWPVGGFEMALVKRGVD